MIATTIMAALMLGWCLITLAVEEPRNRVPWQPDLDTKVELATTTTLDPETGREREVWVKDPQTGRLVPRTDPRTGEPVPKKSEAGGDLHLPLAQLGPGTSSRALRLPTKGPTTLPASDGSRREGRSN